MPRTATVKRLTFPEGRRVLAISDIHGNLPFLKGVLAAAHYGPDDILVLVGDLVEKGPDSLTTLRFIMELAEWNTVYGLRGNCDNLVSEFVAARGEEERFYRHYVDVWRDRCLLVQMGHAAGFETRGPEELPALREVVRARFGPELAFLEAMPEILLTPDYLFVHGGVADEAHLEGLDAWKCMKNDDFLSQGHSFRRWCIVGHWPVTLYHPHVPSAAPLLAEGRHIASIDGGCSLKVDGQLNALIFPTEDSDTFTWQAYDGLPVYTALDRQEASPDSINIRWGRSDLELLESGEEFSLCRHLESGRELYILTSYLRRDGERLWCEDSTDYRLPVLPGDRLSLVARTSRGCLMKKNGVTGWYSGRLTDTLEKQIKQ